MRVFWVFFCPVPLFLGFGAVFYAFFRIFWVFCSISACVSSCLYSFLPFCCCPVNPYAFFRIFWVWWVVFPMFSDVIWAIFCSACSSV